MRLPAILAISRSVHLATPLSHMTADLATEGLVAQENRSKPESWWQRA